MVGSDASMRVGSGDPAVVERDVQVGADEDAFAADVEGLDGAHDSSC